MIEVFLWIYLTISLACAVIFIRKRLFDLQSWMGWLGMVLASLFWILGIFFIRGASK